MASCFSCICGNHDKCGLKKINLNFLHSHIVASMVCFPFGSSGTFQNVNSCLFIHLWNFLGISFFISKNLILEYMHGISEFISKYSSVYPYTVMAKVNAKNIYDFMDVGYKCKNVINVTPIDGMNTEHEQWTRAVVLAMCSVDHHVR